MYQMLINNNNQFYFQSDEIQKDKILQSKPDLCYLCYLSLLSEDLLKLKYISLNLSLSFKPNELT